MREDTSPKSYGGHEDKEISYTQHEAEEQSPAWPRGGHAYYRYNIEDRIEAEENRKGQCLRTASRKRISAHAINTFSCTARQMAGTYVA